MTKQPKTCFFCPNPVTNQQKLILVPEKAGSYYTCNLCWLKQRIKLSQRVISEQETKINLLERKIVELEDLIKKQGEKIAQRIKNYVNHLQENKFNELAEAYVRLKRVQKDKIMDISIVDKLEEEYEIIEKKINDCTIKNTRKIIREIKEDCDELVQLESELSLISNNEQLLFFKRRSKSIYQISIAGGVFQGPLLIGSGSMKFGDNSFNNINHFQNNYKFYFDEQQLQKELIELKQKYQDLESNSFSNPQQLKKSILFLATQQILATKRQDTINSLISAYNNLTKSTSRYENINTINHYFDLAGEVAGFVTPIPGLAVGFKTLNKGVTILNEFLKTRAFQQHSAKLEDYLIEDEKALTLLQTTYQSLNSSLKVPSKISPLLSQMLNLNQDDFSQHSVFSITNLTQDSQLKAEDLQRAINALTNHLRDFARDLRQETKQYTEQLETLFVGSEGKLLEKEVEELLNKLVGKEGIKKTNKSEQILELKTQISNKEKESEELVNSTRLKLKSKHLFYSKKRSQKIELLLQKFLTTGIIDSKLESRSKDKKVNLQEITDIKESIKNLQEQLTKLNSEQLENQVVQIDISK